MKQSQQNLAAARKRYQEEPEYAKSIRGLPSGPLVPAPTRYVLREAFGLLIKDSGKTMTPKEWADFGHMEVSVAYADYVLLDKAWVHAAGVIRKRISDAGLLSQFARVFSRSTLDDFWIQFEHEGEP